MPTRSADEIASIRAMADYFDEAGKSDRADEHRAEIKQYEQECEAEGILAYAAAEAKAVAAFDDAPETAKAEPETETATSPKPRARKG